MAELSPWLDDKGAFDPQAVEVLKQSYVDLRITDPDRDGKVFLTAGSCR